jgi:histidinol-phosphatase
MDLSPYLDFATHLAHRAGRITLGYYQTGLRPDFKPDDTPVTAADRAAEQFIRAEIQDRYPEHAILGEEFGESGPAALPRESVKESVSNFRWIIDPIDGTKSFMRGVPLYGVLIGLEIEGQVRVGAAYYPALDEMLSAADGLGCWWNGRRARVSQVPSLNQAWVTCTDPGGFSQAQRAAEWERVQKAAYHRGGWSDAYGYLLVATGRAEVMLDPVMAVWDCGPFPPIFKEAGGYFGDWKGQETIYGKEALATTQTLLPEVLALINS